ncbi:MAG: class I SAM-dependent methyltransferase [Candidatus Eremiobacteraeota bacterium]|nr:class I SAM-dependent methyltransferase [Candidatus Eremiobacteraeota bacterium]
MFGRGFSARRRQKAGVDYANYSDFYDAEHADYHDDVRFFVDEAKRAGGPILELGCGTGRVLFEVAAAGATVWGLDNCPLMLEQANKKLAELPAETQARITLLEGSMASFELNQKFALIYLPFREFMHLMTVRSQLEALACIKRHLRPGGRLILNHYDIDLTSLRKGPDLDPVVYRQKHGDFLEAETGRSVLLSATSTFDPVPQCLYEERIYETLDEQGRVAEKRYVFLTQRWFFRWEMHHLLERAGLRVEHLYGSFKREPYREMGQELIWVARQPTVAELDAEIKALQSHREALAAQDPNGSTKKVAP